MRCAQKPARKLGTSPGRRGDEPVRSLFEWGRRSVRPPGELNSRSSVLGISAQQFRLALLLLWVSLIVLPQTAFAWVETSVRSYHARVLVARDGTAEIRHELVLRVRGGPLQSLEIAGVGTAIEPLPDGAIRRAELGAGTLWPLTVTSTEEGALRLQIQSERGVRGGSYLFEFGYRVALQELGWQKREGDKIRLTFVGPRLQSGVDSAQVTFVVPHAERAPELAVQTEGPGAGILLHQIRRSAETDEIELLRSHLAIGEPAVWQIHVAPEVFHTPPPLESESSAPSLPIIDRALQRAPVSFAHILLSFVLGVLGALLVFSKTSLLTRAAKEHGVEPRPLLPGRPLLRSGGVALGVAATAWFALERQPGAAVISALVPLLLCTFLLPQRETKPRGPGSWKKLNLSELPAARPLPAPWFEPERPRGFLLFTGLVLGFAGLSYYLLSLSPYLSLMSWLGVALLLPLFWTGRYRDLPLSPLEQGKLWYNYTERRLKSPDLRLELWGRMPPQLHAELESSAPAATPDEVRIRLIPNSAPAGLRAFEIALEEGAGAFIAPSVVLRVLDDSPAAERLPAHLSWVRGRSSEEKVAVVRPAAPTPKQLIRLVQALWSACKRSPGTPSASKQATKSSGNGAAQANAIPAAAPDPLTLT